jgi:hypothetical protein
MDGDKLKAAHMRVCDMLGELADHTFAKGVRLTFVMRDPKNDDCYMVVGDDTIDGTISAMERSRNPAKVVHRETAR